MFILQLDKILWFNIIKLILLWKKYENFPKRSLFIKIRTILMFRIINDSLGESQTDRRNVFNHLVISLRLREQDDNIDVFFFFVQSVGQLGCQELFFALFCLVGVDPTHSLKNSNRVQPIFLLKLFVNICKSCVFCAGEFPPIPKIHF